MMTLPIEDLHRIQNAFKDCYDTLFNNSFQRLKRTISIKLKADRFLDRNSNCDDDACANFDFEPIDLKDVDELSDVFYMSTSSDEDFHKQSDAYFNTKDEENKFAETKLLKQQTRNQSSIFNPVYREKLFKDRRLEMQKTLFSSAQIVENVDKDLSDVDDKENRA